MEHFASLREYIAALHAIGEIQEIDAQVDWNLELGAVIQRSYELGSPAPLFNRIRDVEAGFRVLGAPAGVRPLAPGQRPPERTSRNPGPAPWTKRAPLVLPPVS